MSLKALLVGELTFGHRLRSALVQRSYATVTETARDEKLDLTSVDTDPTFDAEINLRPQELEATRNKSRLTQSHRNILNNRRPYEGEGFTVYHTMAKYKQRLLGRYGIEGSGVEPGHAWPTKESIAEMKEYERVAYPYDLKEAWAKIAEDNHKKAERQRLREETLAANMAKTAQWERELNARIAKKEAELTAARMRKERLVEEVRRHFGFKVDTRDEKFKEMIEQKEKEDKKRKKEAKKKEKAEKLLARLMEQSSKEGSPSVQQTNNESTPEKPADLA